MSDRFQPRPRSPASTLRQLKLLVALLILSNVAIGAFGFYSLRAIDGKYSKLIDQTVPALDELERLTASSVETMRSTNPSLYTESANSRAEMVTRARAALAHNQDLCQHILRREWGLNSDQDERQSLRNAGDTFNRTAAQVIDLIAAGQTADANQARETSMRSAFERYLAAAAKSADLLQAECLRTSQTLSARTGSISNIMLGVAGWPVFMLIAFMVAVLVMILLIRIFLVNNQESAT